MTILPKPPRLHHPAGLFGAAAVPPGHLSPFGFSWPGGADRRKVGQPLGGKNRIFKETVTKGVTAVGDVSGVRDSVGHKIDSRYSRV
jgi:hypothetical protein